MQITVVDDREAKDVKDFLEALREIREESGWGEINFVLNEQDVTYHDVRIRRLAPKKKTYSCKTT
jgi:hypothetical protein